MLATIRSCASPAWRGVLSLVLITFGFVAFGSLAAACSNPDPVEPDFTPDSTPQVVDSTDGEAIAPETPPAPTSTPTPTLDDEDIASSVEVGVGTQIEDAQGNLLAIYGFVEWSTPFADLSDAAQADFSFFGDVEALVDPATELVVLDVGMCSAGINSTGFGTAEFFVHDDASDVLSTDPVLDRGVLARHPVVQPGFAFPTAAECSRGWLPVLWSADEPPTTARYVLTTRASAAAEVQRHVYQWDIAGQTLDIDNDIGNAETDGDFGVGQTVTFNEGALADTTVVVDGWAELVGSPSAIEGTRLIAVSLTYCPSSGQLPDFGLAVDGWNIVAPDDDSGLLGALAAADPTLACFDGWLEFAVPFGGVPTGFFASDGANASAGYAEWTLDGAALPAPQS